MSVLIKGAKPPSGCRWCYFNDDSKCALIVGCDFDDTNGMQRLKDCPLIELPDHGDLIDRDEQIERAWRLELNTRELIAEMLNTATVVIPAERSEDDWEEPEINPCRGCDDYDGRGGCKSHGGCGTGG